MTVPSSRTERDGGPGRGNPELNGQADGLAEGGESAPTGDFSDSRRPGMTVATGRGDG